MFHRFLPSKNWPPTEHVLKLIFALVFPPIIEYSQIACFALVKLKPLLKTKAATIRDGNKLHER